MPPSLDAQQMHQRLASLQMLAERFAAQFNDLERGELGAAFHSQAEASSYLNERQASFRLLSADLWLLRLALAWDLFPQRRRLVLRACREELRKVADCLPELFEDEHSIAGPMILPDFSKTGTIFLRLESEITAETLVTGVKTLASIVGLSLGPREEDLSPAQEGWGITDVMIPMTRRLYGLLVPEDGAE